MILTEEWTEGYAIQLRGEHSVSELVDYIIAQNRADLPHSAKVANVSRAFALLPSEAERAMERVAGGILLAAFGMEGKHPDSEHDPIAHVSYCLTVARRERVMQV